MEKFIDRKQAGKFLAHQLKNYANNTNVIALALPRGGVPVAYEIAMSLMIPLDVFLVRKLGVPWHKELAMGAIASGRITLLNEEIINKLKIPDTEIAAAINTERVELQRRELLYRPYKPPLYLYKKIILLIDDGIATGFTMKVAIQALKKEKPAQIIIVVPVAALAVYQEIYKLADKVICPLKPVDFYAVGLWYEQFPQTSDSEVCHLLQKAEQTISSIQTNS